MKLTHLVMDVCAFQPLIVGDSWDAYGACIHKCPNFEITITFYYINIGTSSLDTKWKLTYIIPYFKDEVMTHSLEV